MKAIILAAGKGTRLGVLTRLIPKCLLRVGGIPILQIIVELLDRQKIEDIVVVTGFKEDKIKDLLRDKVKYLRNPFYSITGVISSLWFARNEIIGEDCLIIHADTLFHPDILRELLDHPGDLVLPIDFSKCAKEEMKVKVSNDRVVEINKTMDPSEAHGEFIGVFKLGKNLSKKFVNAMEDILKNEDFHEFYELAIQKLIDDGVCASFIKTGERFWVEIDFPEDLEKARRYFENENT